MNSRSTLADLMLRLARAELVSVDELQAFSVLRFEGLPQSGSVSYPNITGITPMVLGLADGGRSAVKNLDPIAYKPASPLEEPLDKPTQKVLWRLGAAADLELALESLET